MRHVLVVEDDESMLNKLTNLLREVKDLQIDCARDEASARRLMSTNKYQIALVDIELGPGPKDRFAGLAITRDLVNQGCIPLVVSGTGDDTLKGVAATLSGYDFVSKPVNDLDLVHKVEHALEWAESKQTNSEPGTWPDGLTEAPDNPLKIFWKENPVGLTVTQLTLVRCLAKTPGEMVENTVLCRALKSGNSAPALASHFTNIRKKFRDIDQSFVQIVNVPGKGYLWK